MKRAEIQQTDTTCEQLLQHSQHLSQPEFVLQVNACPNAPHVETDLDVLQIVSWFMALRTLTSLAIDC